MSGPSEKSLTHLQRAFKVYEAMHPNPISAAHLATIMVTTMTCACNYVMRLKALGCIERVGGGRRPSYSLAAAAAMPPDDARGRPSLRARASRPTSVFTAARPGTRPSRG